MGNPGLPAAGNTSPMAALLITVGTDGHAVRPESSLPSTPYMDGGHYCHASFLAAMTLRNRLALLLTAASLGLLWPGLTEPVLTITASAKVLGQTREMFRQTQSIWQSVRNLHDAGNNFVAGLILLFSITVPLVKVALLAGVLGAQKPATRARLHGWVNAISKWAMADVFVVGVFIAYLAAKATDNLDAVAERGFFFFVSYCLVSNLAFQLLESPRSAR